MSLNETVDRSYRDNFSIKKYTEDNLVPKYFSEIDPSLRTVGMIAFTTEQISNIAEDVFNSGTVLFRETFPNRAQIPESIYSHAAIFQISNIFSKAASCNFLLVMEEEAIIKNMQDAYNKDTGIYYFYIDKNTIIYVEDIPFTLDYDIEMRIVKKTNELKKDDYLFSATYITSEYKNSVSQITDPYVKIRRSDDGYIALEVKCHQCTRNVEYHNVLTNNTVNYKTIDVNFDGKIAGFDIRYRKPDEETFSTQLEKLVVYSQPISSPFCYYELLDEDTIRISFNTRDDYFSPAYGSEVEIIVYNTLGEKGNFDVYTGNQISIVPTDEKYEYSNSYLTAAKPMTSSANGADALSIDGLQSLAVMGYRTATALTTENDLAEYFRNYKYLYNNSEILFIKKRNDIYERIYGAFMIMKNEDYIYKTNTLNMSLNLSDMSNPEENIYLLEPGILFTSNDTDGSAYFLRNEEYSNTLYNDYQKAIKEGKIPYISDDVNKENLPSYLDRPASFAEYKKRLGVDDKLSIFDFNDYRDLEIYDNPMDNKFLYINPFLIRFKKQPNLVSLYMTYINQKSLLDFVNQNTDSYVQFIMYQVQLERAFSNEKKYLISLKLLPSISISNSYPILKTEAVEEGDNYDTQQGNYILNNRLTLKENDLRVFLVIKDKVSPICYTELIPTEYDRATQNFTFTGEIYTDDHITSDGRLRLLDGKIYRDKEDFSYYKVHEDDATLYNHYDQDGNLIKNNISTDIVTRLYMNGKLEISYNIINMRKTDDILIPMTDVTCTIYTLYHRIYNESSSQLEIVNSKQTDNPLVSYDESLTEYIWTNEYSTASDPLTFLKPLNNVRTNLVFKDYTLANKIIDEETGEESYQYQYDIMDVDMYSLPFIRWNINEKPENLEYFMNSFLAQYNTLTAIINEVLRNETSIDIKFYNTYGRSMNFRIGEDEEVLNTVNLRIVFDMWFIPGTDLLFAKREIKEYIKKEIETINSSYMNNLYISNLMRKIELEFAYVDHIRFKSINNYNTDYQAVKNYVDDLDELTVEERRYYVPELLVIDLDDIIINDYLIS